MPVIDPHGDETLQGVDRQRAADKDERPICGAMAAVEAQEPELEEAA